MSKISIIAAVGHQMAIRLQNKFSFWLPDDRKRSKALTTGNTIIMGWKAFESLPKGALLNQRNAVPSSNPATKCPGAGVFTLLGAALRGCQEEEKVYVIGGASVYRQAMPLVDELCLTEVDGTAPEADASFPAVNTAIWHEKSREVHPVDEKHLRPYAFVDYVRG